MEKDLLRNKVQELEEAAGQFKERLAKKEDIPITLFISLSDKGYDVDNYLEKILKLVKKVNKKNIEFGIHTHCQGLKFDFINEALEFLANRYGAFKYDVEDSRACDPIRYFQEYQSKDHIAKNNGVVYKNNSILKEKWGLEKYYEWANNLK